MYDNRAGLRHLQLGDRRIDLVTRTVRCPDGESARLSLQEARLLKRLALTPESPVSRQELLVEVWDYHPESPSRAPDVAIRRLRTKLEPYPSRPRHVCTELGRGWVLKGLGRAQRAQRPPDPELLGREALCDRVDQELMSTSVQLVGPPGIGKTALARHLLCGRDVLAVPLEGVRDEPGLFVAVAAALGLPLSAVSDVGPHLGVVLRERGLLLWLDAPEAAEEAVVAWLPRWSVRFLVTTRTLLPVGSTKIHVPPLGKQAAADLFQRVSGRRWPADRLGPILLGLDGLPLAIRLAASRAAVLGLDPLTGDEGVKLGRVASGRAPTHLTDALDRSWTLLDRNEQDALIALSVLNGEFSLDTAEQLVVSDVWIGDLLVSLARHSLLQLLPSDPPRYVLLQTVRWFASTRGTPPHERLIDWAIASNDPDWPTLRRIFERARAEGSQRLEELALRIDDTLSEQLPLAERLELLDQAPASLSIRQRRAGLRWRSGSKQALDELVALREEALSASAPEIAAALTVDIAGARRASHLATDDEVEELSSWLVRVHDPHLRVSILLELAEQHADRRSFLEARLALQQAMSVSGPENRKTEILCAIGHVALLQERPEDGLEAVEHALRLTPAGLLAERAWRTLGGLLFHAHDLDGAATAWERALALARELGLQRQYLVSLGNLGMVYADLGDTREARRVIEEALARSREFDQIQSLVPNQLNLAKVSLLDGELLEADELLDAALALSKRTGWAHWALHARLGRAIGQQLRGLGAAEALRSLVAAAGAAGAKQVAAIASTHLALETKPYEPPDCPPGDERAATRLLAAAARALRP